MESSEDNKRKRMEAAKRLLSAPFIVSLEQLNQDIEEDYYDQ